ncbi:MAG: H/ACA ribonucleoprotein complex subunit GAR1 [Halobacteriales archaeon]
MRRLGTLSRIAQGRGIVELDGAEPPPTGATVVDEALEDVGEVIDVVGPVSAPWAVVDPVATEVLVDRLGQRLYLRTD